MGLLPWQLHRTGNKEGGEYGTGDLLVGSYPACDGQHACDRHLHVVCPGHTQGVPEALHVLSTGDVLGSTYRVTVSRLCKYVQQYCADVSEALHASEALHMQGFRDHLGVPRADTSSKPCCAQCVWVYAGFASHNHPMPASRRVTLSRYTRVAPRYTYTYTSPSQGVTLLPSSLPLPSHPHPLSPPLTHKACLRYTRHRGGGNLQTWSQRLVAAIAAAPLSAPKEGLPRGTAEFPSRSRPPRPGQV